MKIWGTLAVIAVALIVVHVLFSTKYYAKDQLPSVCDYLNNQSQLMPRVGPQAKLHLGLAKSNYSQFKCELSDQTIPNGLPFTAAIHISSDSDNIMTLYYGFNFGGIRHFMQPVYYHQESDFKHAHD